MNRLKPPAVPVDVRYLPRLPCRHRAACFLMLLTHVFSTCCGKENVIFDARRGSQVSAH